MNHEHKILLLVGRTGNGKSSTGNSILREDKFKAHGAGEDNFDEIPVKKWNSAITVVDGSGIGDPREDVINGEYGAIAACNTAFDMCGHSFNAILFVLKYGVRFTKQEKDAVQMVKFLFGDDVLKKSGILVMTYGDNFEKGNIESFKVWCEEQKGDFKSLYEECSKRCLLFNNSTKDPKIKDDQLSSLRSVLDTDKLILPYTVDDFNFTVQNRKKIDQIDFPKELNNSSTRYQLDNAKRFLEDTLEQCRRISAELERAKLQEKDPKVVYQINVLLEHLRMTQGLMSSMLASVRLVLISIHQRCQQVIGWVKNIGWRRGERVGPDQ